MTHDPQLLDRLSRRPHSTFAGNVYRATSTTHDPLIASTRPVRWAPNNGPAILYTSTKREGALAEISFHYSQLVPLPRRPIALHTLTVAASKALRLIRSDLASLGVNEESYEAINHPRTQEIGAAIAFLGFDGLIAPNARWPCENLMIFVENVPIDREFAVIATEEVSWLEWARSNSLLPPES